MSSSSFMDKQIMGLSGQSAELGGVNAGRSTNLFDLMNPQEDRHSDGGLLKRDEILPSYDFQLIRPALSPPTFSNEDSSRHSRISTGAIFGSTLDSDNKLTHHNGASVDDVENTVRKYADIILHAMEAMSSRLSQLESRTCILENSVDDLKVSIGNNYGSSDGKLRQLENILREVHASVQVLCDKQELAEAHLELAKLQLLAKTDQQPESSPVLSKLQQQQNKQQQAHPYLSQLPMEQSLQLSTLPPSLPPPPQLPAPNAPPPPPPPPPPFSQQIQPPIVYTPQLALQSQVHSIPSIQPEQYSLKPTHLIPQYTASGQPNEPIHQHQQYQVPQTHLQQSQHYKSSLQVPQYSQSVQPEDQNTYISPSQSFPPNIRQPSQPSIGPILQQYYGSNPPLSELTPANRPPNLGNLPINSSYGGPGFSEPYPHGNSPSHFNTKQSPFSSVLPTSGGSGNYQRLPTAKILPQAAPVGTSSNSGSQTGNRVPVDDVVDKVATMGFSREQVRATVRKLTENGQSVDLNVVLDKLMNDSEVHQPAKGWFGR